MSTSSEESARCALGAPPRSQSPPQSRFRIERVSRSPAEEAPEGCGPSRARALGRFTVVRVPRPRVMSDVRQDSPGGGAAPYRGNLSAYDGQTQWPGPSDEDPLIDPFLI
jgi:hypothetical protein